MFIYNGLYVHETFNIERDVYLEIKFFFGTIAWR